MAKGLRSSTKKANRTQLRSRVFGPVEEARRKRLSAKLLELASKPRVLAEEDVKTTYEHKGEEQQKGAKNSSNAAQNIGSAEEEMEVDQSSKHISHQRSGSARRIEKRGRGKARSSMVFPVYKKGTRVGSRQKQKR